ncbi:MAG: DUF1592 domain-containing protein [Planctomycetales bacterium]
MNRTYRWSLWMALALAGVVVAATGWKTRGDDSATAVPAASPSGDARATDQTLFQEQIQPLLTTYCVRCHNADTMKSGVRVDQLVAEPEDRQIPLLKGIAEQVDQESMPPDDEPQPSAAERRTLADWTRRAIHAAGSRVAPRNGLVRRLTVAQYRNTLRELLGLQEDLTDVLPPDTVSRDGFANNVQTLALAPLQVEAYFDIAQQALDRSLVDERTKPVIQHFRMDLGTAINPQPCPDKLILGANSELLQNADFVVTEVQAERPFAYQPFAMRTAYEFIEGYAGNDTVRGWRKYDSIYHAVFACVRGTPGYPKGEAHQVIPQGLLLRPAIPSPEIFGQSNTYGPMANFKISLRELPEQGNFRVTVKAARYDDGLLLDAGGDSLGVAEKPAAVADLTSNLETTATLRDGGLYQVEAVCVAGKPQGSLTLELGARQFTGQLWERETTSEQRTPFLLVRLPAGDLRVRGRYADNSRLRRIEFYRVGDDSPQGRRFLAFERRVPWLGVHLGLRRDCGSTLAPVGGPQPVSTNELQEFVFQGAINDFPSPDVEKDNVNYLAGVREIGVRSEYTDGRDRPRLLVRSIEFEGPYYEAWPPPAHRRIFIESPHRDDPATYAREVIAAFATRAFRRPATPEEVTSLMAVWKTLWEDGQGPQANGEGEPRDSGRQNKEDGSAGASPSRDVQFRLAIQDALVVVLTSPQFLFLVENSASPEPEDLDSFELASKLSYFLWNAPPDEVLLDLAARRALHESLDAQIDRMLRDERFGRCTTEFVSQWLNLEKLDVVAIDAQRYPRLTRDTKTQLRHEPIALVQHLFQHNLPLRHLIRSEFILANEVVAAYYDLGARVESGFRFVPVVHEQKGLGGVLTQAGILAGLSDGRESNPIKRGAWLARKIIAEPPDDPPPNVPQLPPNEGLNLTLRERLERHRQQKGCVKCHTGIDPWGLPFEEYDAGGLLKKSAADTRSALPDGTVVEDLHGLQEYLADTRIEQVAYSFLKHLASYACGRTLTYNESVALQQQAAALKGSGYPMQELLRLVIHSDLFLKK